MTDRNIRIKIDAKGARATAKALGNDVSRVENAAKGLGTQLTKVAAAVAGVLAGAGLLGKLIEVTKTFEGLHAQLKVVTGSSENATKAMDALRQIASTTPYDVAQVTQAFQKLAALGLEPSQKAIISYGNTASALGKDLNQMIEAVADAATGEFERLKEFGIKSKSEGDRVSFTFQGVTTQVGKNSTEIQAYLMAIGETQFAGSMEEQMKTMGGLLSNLGDSFDTLIYNISKTGVGDAIKAGIVQAISLLSEISAMLESGQLSGYVGAFFGQFDLAVPAVYEMDAALFAVTQSLKFLGKAFQEMPTNIKAAVQISTVELMTLYNSIVAGAEFIKDALKASAFTDISLDDALNAYLEKLEQIKSVRDDSLGSIIDERNESVKAYNEKIAKSDELRAKYEEEAKARAAAAASSDPLAGLVKASASDAGSQGGQSSATDRESSKRSQGSSIADSLDAENQLIDSALALRVETYRIYGATINDINAGEFERQRAQLELSLAEQKNAADLALQEDIARIEERKRQIFENESLSGAEKTEITRLLDEQLLLQEQTTQQALTQINEEGVAARARLAEQEKQTRLMQLGQLGDSLMSLGQGQSKKIFEIGKKLSLAQAAVALPSAVVESFKNGGGYPWGLVPAGAMLATGLKNIQQIKSTTFSGGGSGGSVGGGSAGGIGGGPAGATASQIAQPARAESNVQAIDFGPVISELRASDGVVSTRFAAQIIEAMQDAQRLTGR